MKTKKYIVLVLFLAALIISVMFMGKVNINYNISDYLAEDTETKISLNIIEEEFGMTGDIQVMLENIDVETAKEVQAVITEIENVLTVNFNENDENYYKDGNALFAIIVDGDEYSEIANTVLDEIKESLDDEFAVNYGGSVVSKRNLRQAIQSEIVMILAIALALVVVIMLVTSRSWIEPFVLLLASGVAVLLNMGSNILFGEISYITNAVAAILQLALSVDYSIMLLHTYRSVKITESDSGRAMISTIKSVLKPVSASALTTMMGLLALLFMTMKIGFDIGIVLMKGILISAITSLTLLPVLLLIFEKLMDKTAKRALLIDGKGFCKIAIKAGKAIAPAALAIIILCGFLHSHNTYSFTDSSGDNPSITDTFGKNQAVIIVYPNQNDDYSGENELAEKLIAYKTADGNTVLKSYTAYSNTVREMYDIEKATQKLNMPESDVEMLFVMYYLYGDNSLVDMSPADFVKYAEELGESDPDAQGIMGEDIAKTLRTLIAIDEIMNASYTADQFYDAASDALPVSGLKLFAIEQMYGLYFYDQISQKSINFEEIIKFAAEAVNDARLGDMLDPAVASGLLELADGIDIFKEEINRPLTQNEFRNYMLEEQGVELSADQVALIYGAYFASENDIILDTIAFLPLMNYLISSGQITDAEAIEGIDMLNMLYDMDMDQFREQMDKPMTQAEFQEYMRTEQGVELGGSEVSMLYLSYFISTGTAAQSTIPFLPLMNYLVSAGYVTDAEAIEGIDMLNTLYNMNMDDFKAQMDDQMTEDEFRSYMLTEQGITLESAQVSLLFAAYSASINDVTEDTIPLLPLMKYLVSAEQITDADAIAKIESFEELEGYLVSSYEYDELVPIIEQAATVLTGEDVDINADDLAIQQLYIMYFNDHGSVPDDAISGREFVDFLIKCSEENPIVSLQMPADTGDKLKDACVVDDFMSDANTYDFKEMTSRIKSLQGNIKSFVSNAYISEDTVSGVYIKYAVSEELEICDPIMACDMLDFVIENMDSSGLLRSKMSDEARRKVQDAQNAISDATGLLIGTNYSRILLSVDLPTESAESTEFVRFLSTAVKESLGDEAHIAGEMVSTYDLQMSFASDNKLISTFTIVSIFIIIMLLFGSVSLPVILVAVIQGAIWVAMSTSLLTGPMFFMSYIMATCILMGSTIDYGILMSTNYVRYRATVDKKEALYLSVKAAMPTIFTSGLILTICGVVVGFVASQNSISTVGFLLGKGTLISIIMITVVLPSLLYLLDSFILKLSIKFKK